MTKEGIKYLSYTRIAPKDYKSSDLSGLAGIFEEVCGQVLKCSHRAKVSVNDTKKGKTITFSIAFGSRQNPEDFIREIVKGLIEASLKQARSIYLRKKVSTEVRHISERYDKMYSADKPHIKIKPQEHKHIKLC